MTDLLKIDQYLETNLKDSLSELKTFCAQPSIAAQGLGMVEAAKMVSDMLEKRGFEVQVIDTDGFPVVVADRIGTSDKTILIYNHYDVQPPEPLELWTSPHLNQKSVIVAGT